MTDAIGVLSLLFNPPQEPFICNSCMFLIHPFPFEHLLTLNQLHLQLLHLHLQVVNVHQVVSTLFLLFAHLIDMLHQLLVLPLQLVVALILFIHLNP